MVDSLIGCQNQVRLLEQVNAELDLELGEALDTIQKLQNRIDQMIDDSLPDDSCLNSKVLKLQNKIDQLVGRKEYIATNVSDIYREKYPSVFQPVPYPYTHPIRDIGTSGSIKVKK